MRRLPAFPILLLALNWCVLLATFIRTSVSQGNALWWLRLDWSGWLGDFTALATLSSLPAGSVWLMWLAVSLVWTAAAHLSRSTSSTGTSWTGAAIATARETPAGMTSAASARRQLEVPSQLMHVRPELRDKILRLHQSLDRL